MQRLARILALGLALAALWAHSASLSRVAPGAAAPPPVAHGAPTQFGPLAGLVSYRFRVVTSDRPAGGSDTQARDPYDAGFEQIDEGAFLAPDRYHVVCTSMIADRSSSREVIVRGGEAWARRPAGDWQFLGDAYEDSCGPHSWPAATLAGLRAADLASFARGFELLNGLTVRRYAIDAVSIPDPRERTRHIQSVMGEDAEGDESFDDLIDITLAVWLADDSGYPVKLVRELWYRYYTAPRVFTVAIELRDLNAPDIDIPAP